MSRPSEYASPAAFRSALTDRLRLVAGPNGRWSLPELQRQVAYDRLLARLYHHDRRWVLKGATALLARHIGARHTLDVDLYRATALREVERDFRAAAATDLRDWFRFEVGASAPQVTEAVTIRLHLDAYVGSTRWADFKVDLVGDSLRMTGVPDEVQPISPIALSDGEGETYLAYPLVDHIADKVCGILERHGASQLPSTRYKDLVDLVVLATHVRVDAQAQVKALSSELSRRGLATPERFAVPQALTWERGYAAEARRASGLGEPTIDKALAVVTPFVDALLAGSATGQWEPAQRVWRSASRPVN